MKKLLLLTLAISLGTFGSGFGQMQIDKAIQLTGSGSDAKIEGIQEVINPTDAANKAYVDSMFNVLLALIPDDQMYFTLTTNMTTANVIQGLSTSTYNVTVTYDSGAVSNATLSVLNMPSGMVANFGQSSGVPDFTSTISFTTSSGTSAGTYNLDIIALSGSYSDTVQVSVTVEAGALIWQTVNQYNGNLGGLSGADAICNNEAASAGLGGNYIALLSDGSTSMVDRVTISAKFVRPDGALVANSKTDLFDGTIANRIEINAIGGTNPTGNPGRSFTGTNSNGTTRIFTETCNGWTSSSSGDFGGTGESQSTTGGSFWRDGGNQCNTATFLFCVAQ